MRRLGVRLTASTRREADRIKAVVLLGKGWTPAEVAEALLLDEDTVRNYLARYRRGKLQALREDGYVGVGTWVA